jgi:putative toxin-antitoxin system antitoxin component (TIGR02293 family)
MSQAALKSSINRAIKTLVSQIEKQQGYRVLKQPVTYEDFLSNKLLLVHAIEQGVPFSLFQLIARETPFSDADWAGFLNLSTKSLQRYRMADAHIFKPLQSEKILALAEVTHLGKKVFGDSEKFYRWLTTPNYALGNLQPLELLKNSYGQELVVDELHRIDQAIFV